MPDDSKLETIPVEDNVVFVYIVSVSSPFYEIMINLFTKACTTFVSNDSETAHGYEADTYLISADCPRFGSGEAKGVLNESVRGKDIYIMVDVGNYSCTYMMAGQPQRMSPDDHYADLKRLIAAMTDKPKKITVIMPFLHDTCRTRQDPL